MTLRQTPVWIDSVVRVYLFMRFIFQNLPFRLSSVLNGSTVLTVWLLIPFHPHAWRSAGHIDSHFNRAEAIVFETMRVDDCIIHTIRKQVPKY